jgi:hypothetical protein
VLSGLVWFADFYNISAQVNTFKAVPEAAATSALTTPQLAHPARPPAAASISCVDDGLNRITLSVSYSSDTGYMPLQFAMVTYTVSTLSQSPLNIWLNNSVVFANAPNGADYGFTVGVWNAAGKSSDSNTVTCTAATVPNCPANVAAVAGPQQLGQLQVAWDLVTGVANNGGATVAEYLITYRPLLPAGSPNVTVLTNSTSIRVWNITGLQQNANYSVTVQARNRKGLSASCPVVIGQTSGAPDPPILQPLVPFDSALQLTLLPAAQTGGVALVRFNCSYWTSANPPSYLSQAVSAAMPWTLAPLTNGLTYSVSCTATNLVGGVSLPSVVRTGTPASLPLAPTNMTIVSGPGLGQLNVTWIPDANTGGVGLTSFNVSWTLQSAPFTTGFVLVVPPVAPYEVVLSNLTGGALYTVSIRAVNPVGPSIAAISATGQPAGAPCPPTAVTVTADNKALQVSWTASACTGGLPLQSYTLFALDTATGQQFVLQVPASQVPLSAVMSGLTNGNQYTVTALASNAVANSTLASGSPSPAQPRWYPAPPVLTGTQFGNATLTLLLSPPTDVGGLVLVGYTCYSAVVPADPLALPRGPALSFGPSGPFVVSLLSNGVNYSFACAASNSFGTGNFSSPLVFGMPATTPDPPINLVAAAGPGRGGVNTSWNPPAWDGGLPVTSFLLSWVEVRSGVRANMTVVSTGALNYGQLLTGLTLNSSYFVTVQSVNGVGMSAVTLGPTFSHAVYTTPADLPCPPESVSAQRGDGAITVRWATPLCDGGMPLLGYFAVVTLVNNGSVVTNGPSRTVWMSAASSPPFSVLVSGLTNSFIYSIAVAASNALGNSTWATAPNISPAAVPAAIVALQCASGPTKLGSLTLSWSSTPSGGDPAALRFNFTLVEQTQAPGTGRIINLVCGEFSCEVPSLTPRLNYSITGFALNSVGAGPSTLPIYCAAAAQPDVIAPLSCEGADASIRLLYSAPASTLPLLTYEANWTLVSAPVGTAPSTTSSPSGVPITTITGLTNEVPYALMVRACNRVGCAAPSATVQCTPGVAPGVPTAASCQVDNNQITVLFSAPVSGSTVTKYTVERHMTGALFTSPTAGSIVVTGLPSASEEVLTLWSSNSYGSSTSNVTLTCTTLDLRPPDNAMAYLDPTPPLPSVPGDIVCAVWFTPYPKAPSDPSRATNFEISYWDRLTGSALTATVVTATTVPMYLMGLAGGSIYDMQVRGTNGASGARSFPSPIFTCRTANTVFNPATIPTAAGLVSSPGNGTAGVAITPPASNGGRDIVAYWVFTSGGAGVARYVPFTTGSTATLDLVPNLVNGLVYSHYVLSDNSPATAPQPDAPMSIPSALVSEVPNSNYAVSGAPLAQDVRMTPGDARVGFDVLSAPPNPSGSPILGYAVRWPAPTSGTAPGPGSSAVYANNSVPQPHLLAMGNLLNGVYVNFTVEAFNGAGWSLPLFTGSIAPGILPSAPRNIVPSPRNGSIDVFFSPPLDQGTNTVTGYQIFYRDAPLSLPPRTGAGAPITMDGLTNNVLSNFTICAVSSVSDTRPQAPPLWQSAPGSCMSFSATSFPRSLPNLNGTLIFARPLPASMPITGVQGLDNLCLERMSFSRALVCDERTDRTVARLMGYLPQQAPVFVFNAGAWPVATYTRAAASPSALLASGIQTGVGFSPNFTSFFDETAPVGVSTVGSPSAFVSHIATDVAFTGCTAAGLPFAGQNCQNWTSTSSVDAVATGKAFALTTAADYANGWINNAAPSDCGASSDKFLYCVWAPTASDGVKNGDETGVDCGGHTLTYDGQESFPCVVPPPSLSCPARITVPTVLAAMPPVGLLVLPAVGSGINVSSVIRYSLAFTYVSSGAEARTGDSLDFFLQPFLVKAALVDGKGQTANCTFQVAVIDVEPPVIHCPANLAKPTDVGADYASGIVWPVVAGSATDNVGVVNITVPPPSTQYPSGYNNVTFIARDAAGNEGSCTFVLTVGDVEPPTFTYCPQFYLHPLDAGRNYATLSYPHPVAIDNVGLAAPTNGVLVEGLANGAIVNVSTLTGERNVSVSFLFSDLSGNSAFCNFTVLVADTEPPALSCPASQVTFTDVGSDSAVLEVLTTAPTDNVRLMGSYSRPRFGVGVSLVQLAATDERGNEARCTYSVTVSDREPPVVTCPPDVVVTFQPGQAFAPVYFTFDPFATDNVNVTYTNATHVSGDMFPVATMTTVTFAAGDAANNTAACSFYVTALSTPNPPTATTIDLGDPAMACPEDLVRVARFASEPFSAVADWLPPRVVQNSRQIASLGGSAVEKNGTVFGVGIHTLSYSLTDASGFSAQCSFRVSVLYPTPDAEGVPARGQVSLRFVTTDVLALQVQLKSAIAAALNINLLRITIVSVVAAFNRTDVVVEFAPRAPTYYSELATASSSRRLLATTVTSDASESSELLSALYEQVLLDSSSLRVTPIGQLLVVSSFINCTDAESNPSQERATGCNMNSTSFAGIGFQCPIGCVPLDVCTGYISSSGDDEAFQREWRAVVITSAVWLALLLLLALAHYCGWLACTRHSNAVGHGRKQPPTVPWPTVRDTSFRPLAPDADSDAGDLRFHQ